MSEEQFADKQAAGKLVQVTSYGKTSYGIDRAEVQRILQDSNGICILVDSGVDELQQLGFPLSQTITGLPPDIVLAQPPVEGDDDIN
jgi:hypothetical protein